MWTKFTSHEQKHESNENNISSINFKIFHEINAKFKKSHYTQIRIVMR